MCSAPLCETGERQDCVFVKFSLNAKTSIRDMRRQGSTTNEGRTRKVGQWKEDKEGQGRTDGRVRTRREGGWHTAVDMFFWDSAGTAPLPTRPARWLTKLGD